MATTIYLLLWGQVVGVPLQVLQRLQLLMVERRRVLAPLAGVGGWGGLGGA